jgi:hypothetical protein
MAGQFNRRGAYESELVLPSSPHSATNPGTP